MQASWDFPAVRWSNERRWYLYEKGKPMALWHPTRHDMSLAYYNFDRPPQPGLAERIAGLLRQLKLRSTGTLRERVWVDEAGRPYVSRNYTSGESTQTANLAALDLEGARFSKTYEMLAKITGYKPTPEELAARREILIRCQSEAPECVTSTSNTADVGDQLTIATDESDVASFRAALQKIAGLFPPVSASVVEDAACRCTRIIIKPR